MPARRIVALALGLTLALTGVLGRLFHLQIVRGDAYLEKAKSRSLRLSFVPGRRGTIYARSGGRTVPLAEDRPAHDISVRLRDLDPAYVLARRVAGFLGADDAAALARRFDEIERLAPSSGASEFVLWPALPSRAATKIGPRLSRCPGARLREGAEEKTFDVILPASTVRRPRETLRLLSTLVEIEPEAALVRVREMIREAMDTDDTYQQEHDLRKASRLEAGIPFEMAILVEDRHADLPGVVVGEGVHRAYPQGPTAGHLLGHLGSLGPEDVVRLEAEGKIVDRWRGLREIDSLEVRRQGAHFIDDLVGRNGVERAFEDLLRGTVGLELVERDARGRLYREVARRAPVPGEDLHLTIDLDVQRVAEEALARAVAEHETSTGGAVVAIDVRTGGVIALVSYPAFDASRVRKDYGHLLRDPRSPLTNRAIRGVYPPGSVFKIVTAIAALESGVLRPGETIECRGVFKPGGRFFKCHGGPHGWIDVREAMQKSCNIFFYELGERLGPERLKHWGERLGLGAPSGIEIPGEKGGLLPDPEWLLQTHDQKWMKGFDRNYAIGQGYTLVTPVQIARLLATVARGGAVPAVHLGERLAAAERTRHADLPPLLDGLPASTIDPVREGLRWVVQRQGGTAWSQPSLRRIRAAGKTGTAQASRSRNHAWFAGYAPADDPQVAVAAVVEWVPDGSYGGGVSGPVVAAVLEAYFAAERTD